MKNTAIAIFILIAGTAWVSHYFTKTYCDLVHDKKPEGGQNYSEYDYFININDDGTAIYSTSGQFVDYVRFDSASAWDKALMYNNQ